MRSSLSAEPSLAASCELGEACSCVFDTSTYHANQHLQLYIFNRLFIIRLYIFMHILLNTPSNAKDMPSATSDFNYTRNTTNLSYEVNAQHTYIHQLNHRLTF